jgi:hypothetical protein
MMRKAMIRKKRLMMTTMTTMIASTPFNEVDKGHLVEAAVAAEEEEDGPTAAREKETAPSPLSIWNRSASAPMRTRRAFQT